MQCYPLLLVRILWKVVNQKLSPKILRPETQAAAAEDLCVGNFESLPALLELGFKQ